MKISQDKGNVNVLLGAFYAVCGSSVSFCIDRYALRVDGVRLLFMSLWMGFVLAISFMEGWLKFRAPFVPRHLALDIGRHIFPALNAVEIALCFCQWLLLVLYPDLEAAGLRCLMLLTLILTLEVLIYTPRLVLRGKKIVLSEVRKNKTNLSPEHKELMDALELELQGQHNIDSPKNHIIYVSMEHIKVILGFIFIWNFL